MCRLMHVCICCSSEDLFTVFLFYVDTKSVDTVEKDAELFQLMVIMYLMIAGLIISCFSLWV